MSGGVNRPMRIAIGQVAHETNTFCSGPTSAADFQAWEWALGDEIIQRHSGVRDYLGGMIAGARERGVEVAPTFATFAYPSGTIAAGTYRQILDTLLEAIRFDYRRLPRPIWPLDPQATFNL